MEPDRNMNCQYWINPAPEIHEQLLPGARGSGLVPLWILLDAEGNGALGGVGSGFEP